MLDLRFRVQFQGAYASAEDLANIEEITVEQTEDAAWEARVIMGLCLAPDGNWEKQKDPRFRPRQKVRVELKIGQDDFQPLIEGPIVSVDTAMDSRPGRSTATIVVHDDSAWLNLESKPFSAVDRTDQEIARELFTTRSMNQVKDAQIEIPEPATGSLGPQFAQLGTAMQMLKHLAERNGCHAYVLPGAKFGQTMGCLKPDTKEPATLPPLVLLGEKRNLAEVNATEDPERSERTVIHTLRLGDQQPESYTTQESDETLLGPRPAAPQAPARQAPATTNDSENATASARARQRRKNYPLKLTGRVIPGAYPKVLRPYQKVELRAGGALASTTALLTKVTHRITPSAYTVEFEGRGNSLGDPDAPPAPKPNVF